MRRNGLGGGTYIEPYAGGAGAALYLLLNRYVAKIVINDLDLAISSFWRAILQHNEEFINLLEKVPLTLDEREKQRNILEHETDFSTIELGFATFYLNRVNRSGILSGGVIGGKQQTGKYKLDARFHKRDLINRIRKIGQHSDSIDVHCMDALELLDLVDGRMGNKSLLYMDPPYFNKGSRLYKNHYASEDHIQVAERVKEIVMPWLVTYDNCEFISRLYEDQDYCEFSLTYSTSQTRPKGSELMIYNGVTLPSDPFLVRSVRPFPSTWL